MLLQKKYCVSIRVLNLFQDLFVSCLKVLVRVRAKDKLLVKTENPCQLMCDWRGCVSCFFCTGEYML